MSRTRDLRVALLWSRSVLNTDGLPGLLPSLQLLTGLVDTFWETGLHPAVDPDDGDAFARISVVGSLDKLDGLLGDVRVSLVHPDRRLSGLRVRDTEIAMEKLSPRPDESPRTLGEMQGVLGEFPDIAQAIRSNVGHCLQALKQLQRVMNDRFGMDQAVDVKALRVMLDCVKNVLPEAVTEGSAAGDGSGGDVGSSSDGTGAATTRGAAGGGGGGSLTRIDSRKDAIKAINLVCQYLERSEPTNPAQFLLRRAERLIEKNFLQLVRDLAPDAMSEVARIMGVDPDSIRADE
jgi:type VI secretion system protein ImpA